MDIAIIIISLLGWIVPLIACVIIGREKNRKGFLWGFFLGFVGLIVLALLPPLENRSSINTNYKKPSERFLNNKEIKCSSCGSIIDAAYISCPNCGARIDKNKKIDRIFTVQKTALESSKIICPYCKKQFTINTSNIEFKNTKCIFCKKLITNKNVIFV